MKMRAFVPQIQNYYKILKLVEPTIWMVKETIDDTLYMDDL
jgi:hypothetical protein